jgi:hypothetical protein
MKFYKYTIVDESMPFHTSSSNLGYCYLSIAPSKDDVLREYCKVCSDRDKTVVDNSYENMKCEIRCGKLPGKVFIYYKDKLMASLEPQRDQ